MQEVQRRDVRAAQPCVQAAFAEANTAEHEVGARGAKEAVDFAKVRHLDYIEFDAGWYGLEYDDASDARRVEAIRAISR